MRTQLLALAAMLSGIVAAMCTKEGIELAANNTNNANPYFVDPATGDHFYKYVQDVGDATEAEMNTIEYITSYAYDSGLNMWLVSEEGFGVIQLTALYQKHFSEPVTREEVEGDPSYFHDPAYFLRHLDLVRGDDKLQNEAQDWVDLAKQQYWDDAGNAKRELENRQYVNCGPSRCQSERTCLAFSSSCPFCRGFRCQYFYLPIVDAC